MFPLCGNFCVGSRDHLLERACHGSGWALSGGAVVEGNESFFLNESDDTKSLALPAGSTAVSPPICMSFDTPSFRLMARNLGDPTSRLRVEAGFKLLGLVRTRVVVGTLIPSAIRIEVTPLDDAGEWQVDEWQVDEWQVDDLYIDPFRRH